jgi:CHAT domain-containing protein
MESAIVLSPAGNTFKLYARDVAQVPLNAELVTISACRGAGARVYSGEGLVGFTWAFLQAGARNVIAGLWDVTDLSTAQLMDHLYENLSAGKSPSQALRAAKLSLIHSQGNFRKPYYWGPFQVYIGGGKQPST